jgi:hypothetical protein
MLRRCNLRVVTCLSRFCKSLVCTFRASRAEDAGTCLATCEHRRPPLARQLSAVRPGLRSWQASVNYIASYGTCDLSTGANLPPKLRQEPEEWPSLERPGRYLLEPGQ